MNVHELRLRDVTCVQYRLNVELLCCIEDYLSTPEYNSMLQFVSSFPKIIKVMPMKEEVVKIFSSIACVKRRLFIINFGCASTIFQKLEGYVRNADDVQKI